MVKADDKTNIAIRDNYNGAWVNHIVTKRQSCSQKGSPVFKQSYDQRIPLKRVKYSNIQDLGKFCTEASAAYLRNLPVEANEDAPETDESDGEGSLTESDNEN